LAEKKAERLVEL
jgi:hypothetical protein